MIYPIYKRKRCRRRDQIGWYDDSGYVYRGRKTHREGQPPENSLVGCFDREGRVFRDVWRQSQLGELTPSGGVYTVHPVTGKRVEGFADSQGQGFKGVAQDFLAVCVPQGDLRQQAAAAALLLLEDDLPKKRRLEDLPRWLEVIVDLVDLVVDIVT